jgi:hypothetical protein
MNCLEIIQQACITLGFASATTVTDKKDSTTMRLMGLLNRTLEGVLRDYQWQKMIKFCNFEADQKSGYNQNLKGYNLSVLAPGFQSFVSANLYNETQQETINSITYDQYILDKMQGGASIDNKFILQNNHILFMPQPELNSSISFFYKSKAAVYNFDGEQNLIAKEYFTSDLDECEIEATLLLSGLIYKYKYEMGFDYAESYRDFQNYLETEKSTDGNLRKIKDYSASANIKVNGGNWEIK